MYDVGNSKMSCAMSSSYEYYPLFAERAALILLASPFLFSISELPMVFLRRSPTSLVFFGNRICPFAHRAWWTLVEKGVQNFDYIHIDLGGKKPKWYSADVYEAGTVPCLFDGGKFLGESLNVAEYLEDKHHNEGTKILPSDAFQRAEIRTLIGYWNDKVQKLCYGLLMNQDRSADEGLKENLSKALKGLNDRFVAQSSGPYFLGKDLSMADIAIVPFLDRFVTTLKHYRDFEMLGSPDTTRLKELYEECKKRPAFQKTTQTPDFYIGGYRGYANPKL